MHAPLYIAASIVYRHSGNDQSLVFFQAEDGIRDIGVIGVKTCALLFSSRRRHTRYWRDWSSDVCSSDLARAQLAFGRDFFVPATLEHGAASAPKQCGEGIQLVENGSEFASDFPLRSEERRVGKECRSRWSPYH